MKKKKTSLGITLFFTFFLTPLSQAEIGYKDLKGVHHWIKPEYQVYSPIYGDILLSSESLRNYRFMGNYGPRKEPPQKEFHGCMDLTPAYRRGFTDANGDRIMGLEERHDCPQDFTSEWIQRLFPSVDGHTLTENGAGPDLISHMTPGLIGRLIARLAKVKDEELQEPSGTKKLSKDLEEILAEALSPEEFHFHSEIESLASQSKKKQTARFGIKQKIGICSDESEKQTLERQVKDLNQEVEDINQQIKELKDGRSRVQSKWSPKIYSALATVLVEALKESRGGSAQYPRHLPEQALMAFFLKKYNSKEDLIALFKGMPELLRSHEILDRAEVQEHFKAEVWKAEDRKIIPKDVKASAQFFIENPEAFNFEVRKRSEEALPIPPFVSYKTQVPHSSLKEQTDEKERAHGDCGETMVRNVINFALYNPDTGLFDTKRLKELKEEHPELKFSQAMIKFYERNPDPSKAGTDGVHEDWNETVLSRLPFVNYRQGGSFPVCDMNAGVDNFMSVMDQLLFAPKGKGSTSLSAPGLLRSKKMDELFRLLSHKNSHLNWSIKGKDPQLREQSEQILNTQNVDVNLDIRLGQSPESAIKSQPIMELGFTPGHFSVTDLSKRIDPWKANILKELVSHQGHHPVIPLILPALIDSHSIDVIPQENQTPAHFQSLPLRSASDKVAAFKKIVSSHESKKMKSLGLRIKKQLGTADVGTLKEISIAESDNHFPFDGDQVHVIGKPDTVYTRVSYGELKEKFGEDAAKQMGHTWVRKMYGHNVAIGELLLNSDGKVRNFNFEDAKKACLDLNPPERRAAVANALEQREDLMFAIRKNKGFTDEARREAILQVHSEPIPGIYLMSKEEFEILEKDFGYREQGTIPQILPKFHGRWFWTSSGHPDLPESAMAFDGDDGKVRWSRRMFNARVRCAGAW